MIMHKLRLSYLCVWQSIHTKQKSGHCCKHYGTPRATLQNDSLEYEHKRHTHHFLIILFLYLYGALLYNARCSIS